MVEYKLDPLARNIQQIASKLVKHSQEFDEKQINGRLLKEVFPNMPDEDVDTALRAFIKPVVVELKDALAAYMAEAKKVDPTIS